MKINKAKIRREAAQKVAMHFINTGIEMECLAILFSSERNFALEIAQELLDSGINLSKSAYPFAYVGNMADMFLSDAVKIVNKS